MATGKSGSFEVTGTKNMTFRISWSETYNAESNTHVVSITNLEAKFSNSSYDKWNEYYLGNPNGAAGYINVNGVAVAKFYSSLGGYHISPSYNNYYAITVEDGFDALPWESGTITGNSDGSCSATISYDFSGYSLDGLDANGFKISGSTSVTLTTIPRASSISGVENKTLGEACSVTWTPISANFYYKLRFAIGSWSHTTDVLHPNKTTSYTYTDYIFPITVANQITKSASGTMTATLYTYSNSAGTVQVGSAASKTFTVYVPAGIVPTMGSLTVSLDNSNNSILEQWGVAVVGFTRLAISATASGAYGSTISSFTISGEYDKIRTGSSLHYTTDVITHSGDVDITVCATDSRSRKSLSETKTMTVYAYSKPDVDHFYATRSDENPQTVIVSASWGFSSINKMNSAVGMLYYKKSTESSWNTYGEIISGSDLTLDREFDNVSSYNFWLVVTDTLGSTAESEAFISTQEVLLDFRAGGKGLGIGKICESDSLEVGMDAEFMKELYIYLNGERYSSANLFVDFVIEQSIGSESGVWYYRKWNSGLCDLWCIVEISNLACDVEVGSMYRTEDIYFPEWPFAITDVNATISYDTVGYGGIPWAVTQNTDTDPARYFVMRPNSITIENGRLHMQVKAMWK